MLYSNLEILKIIEKECRAYPDLRFGQILRSLEVVVDCYTYKRDQYGTSLTDTYWKDEYYLKSEDLLKRISK